RNPELGLATVPPEIQGTKWIACGWTVPLMSKLPHGLQGLRMKIRAIKRELSNGEAIALKTEPPLTQEVFDAIVTRELSPKIRALSLRTVSGCLLLNSASFTPGLRGELEKLLTEAEDVVSGVAADRRAKLEKRDREINVQSAASGFG